MKRKMLRFEELERREVLSAAGVLANGPPIIPSGLLTALASPGAEFRSQQATASLTRNLGIGPPIVPPGLQSGPPIVPPGLLVALASPGAEFRSEQATASLNRNLQNDPPIVPSELLERFHLGSSAI